MNYEINVSKNGRHYFATHERSLQTRAEAEAVYNDLKSVFTKERGFLITVSLKQSSSTAIHFEPNLEQLRNEAGRAGNDICNPGEAQ